MAENREVLSDRSACTDPMTTATAEMFLRQRDDAMEAWKARGRELNALYEIIEDAVAEPTPDDPMADLKALVTERDELRAGISWARGMCTDEAPTAMIDHFLGCVLAGKAQSPLPADEEGPTRV